jgi:hypothetical protein
MGGVIQSTRLDFGSPLQARKWLRLLREDPISGIRIQPNLRLDERVLGFSFESNRFGMRGPCAETGKAVVLGTSFAMGFAVNTGEDWYSGLLEPGAWFNAGLPVGPKEWAGLLEAYFRGERQLALVLYHPNLWPHALTYDTWRNSGKGAFEFFRWKTGLWECFRVHLRKKREREILRRAGKRVLFREGNREFCFDATYSFMPAHQVSEDLCCPRETLRTTLRTFRRVVCIRVPIKEQLIPDSCRNEHFDRLHACYDQLWDSTQRLLENHDDMVFAEAGGFRLDHFHGFDTHLTVEGNVHLRKVAREILVKTGMTSFCT